ncbi:hypothetical protein ACQVQ3_26780 [Bacillus cereus]|uniref:hypothetical protein n=1 Tax=Bacillus cereus group TaxID=86661 RepID=UPI0022E2E2C7|nr:hypothetical protein [Bacillus mobilis]
MAVVVKKENRVLTVEEQSLDAYLAEGYDQVELNEERTAYVVVTRATGGREVTLSELNTVIEEKDAITAERNDLLAENKKLKAEIAKLKKDTAADKTEK